MKAVEPARKTPDPWDRKCPSRSLLDLISGKWTLLIFPVLSQKPRRNAELLRLVDGISQKVMTEILRDLEQHGLVARHDYGTVPPKVEYGLTELGRTLAKTIGILDKWVIENYYQVARARDNARRKAKSKGVREPLPGDGRRRRQSSAGN